SGLIQPGVEIVIDGSYLGQECGNAARLVREDPAESLAQLYRVFRDIDAQAVQQITVKNAAPDNPVLHPQLGKKPSKDSIGSKSADILDAGIKYEAPGAPVTATNPATPRSAIAARSVVGFDYQDFEATMSKQGRCGKPPDARANNGHMIAVRRRRPRR